MTHATPDNVQEVLFVGLSAEELPPGLATQLAQRGTPPSYCGDVYRAMARIGKRRPAAVVAGVDWLSAPELEFFEILARSYPELPVYVVGADRARGKIDRAVGFGASGLATLDAFVAELAPAADETATAAVESASASEGSKGSDMGRIPFAPTGNVFDAELDRRLTEAAGAAEPDQASERQERAPDEFEDISGEVDTASARVPWLRYEGGPRRIPPSDAPSNGDSVEQASEEQVDQVPDVLDDPPLLTPEELEALLAVDPDDEERD